MASFNKVILMGNLTRDPEVRFIPSGTAVADLSLAVNENFKNKTGETVENTVFVDVIVWARQAETCAEYLSKGSPVLVEGRLQMDKWQTKEGESRTKIRVRADRVQFLGSPGKAEFKDGGPAKQEAAPADAPNVPADEPASGAQDEPDVNSMGDDDNLPF